MPAVAARHLDAVPGKGSSLQLPTARQWRDHVKGTIPDQVFQPRLYPAGIEVAFLIFPIPEKLRKTARRLKSKYDFFAMSTS
jgi:hypothetical protein